MITDQRAGSPKHVHKSRRKATAKTTLGSRDNNRSMPDLSVISGQEKSAFSQSTTLATFQSPTTSHATMCVRSAARETLLNELSQKFQMRACRAHAQECSEDDEEGQEDEFPPPPPELLYPAMSEERLPELADSLTRHLCTLCGQRLVVTQDPYCQDCQIYLSRFSKRL